MTNQLNNYYFLASTAYHAIELGFRTVLIEDCSRGIRDESINSTFEKVKASHGCVVHSSEVRDRDRDRERGEGKVSFIGDLTDGLWLQVKAMVQGRDRRPELGYKLALEVESRVEELFLLSVLSCSAGPTSVIQPRTRTRGTTTSPPTLIASQM